MKIKTSIICPQCKNGEIVIKEEDKNGNPSDELIASFENGVVKQEPKDLYNGSDSFLVVKCSKCDADFEINYDNELVYWGLDMQDYIYKNSDWVETGKWGN